jgi:hypothetical protein
VWFEEGKEKRVDQGLERITLFFICNSDAGKRAIFRHQLLLWPENTSRPLALEEQRQRIRRDGAILRGVKVTGASDSDRPTPMRRARKVRVGRHGASGVEPDAQRLTPRTSRCSKRRDAKWTASCIACYALIDRYPLQENAKCPSQMSYCVALFFITTHIVMLPL